MISQLIVYTCDICGQTKSEKFELNPNFTMARECLPDDWEIFKGMVICENHEIIIKGFSNKK